MSVAQIYDLYAQKVADITHIPYPYIIALRDQGMLDQKAARDRLIYHDYWKLVKTKKLTENQILEKLAGMYDIDKRKIQYVIKNKPKRMCYCRNCGTHLPRTKFFKNDGLCDRCITHQIIL